VDDFYAVSISTCLIQSHKILTVVTFKIIYTGLLDAEIDLTKTVNECADCIQLDDDTIQFRTSVNAAINLPVWIKARAF
jgi:hypothetical protein